MNNQQKGAVAQTTVSTTLATVLSVLAALGFVHFKGPNHFIKQADPKVLESIARPDKFTRSDYRQDIAIRDANLEARLRAQFEAKLAPINTKLSVLEEAFAEFARLGPRQVNEKLDTIIKENRQAQEQDRKRHAEMLRGQQRHFDETKTMLQQRYQLWRGY